MTQISRYIGLRRRPMNENLYKEAKLVKMTANLGTCSLLEDFERAAGSPFMTIRFNDNDVKFLDSHPMPTLTPMVKDELTATNEK